jgi:hypothetical protein
VSRVSTETRVIGRRGFLGALAGLPIAAVVVPKVSIPDLNTPEIQPLIRSNREFSERYAREYCHKGFMTPNEVRQREGLHVTISCDTQQLQRDLDRAARRFEREVTRAMSRVQVRT